MPRLAICSRDLHWHWINRTLLCDTMEVSMLSRAWLTIAQHVFQPVLTGGPELISRKIVSGKPGTKAIAVSRFREKLSPANWVQGVTAISRKISRSWAPKNGVQHATAIYPIPRYTRPRYIGLTLYSLLATRFVAYSGSRWPYLTKELAFTWIIIICIGYILWKIFTPKPMFDFANMQKTITVKDVPMNNYELLNIQACSFLMFWNRGCTQSPVVSCNYWVVPLISTRVSGYNQVILLRIHHWDTIGSGNGLMPNQYLTQWWPSSVMHVCVTRSLNHSAYILEVFF